MGLLHRDAALDHPAMPLLLARLAPVRAVAVPRYPLAGSRQGRCYWNVRDQVRAQGGKCVFGWMLVEIPGVALFAWHHAIWEASSGQLSDISPHPVTGWGVGSTAFAVDPVQDYPLDWPPAMPQVFEPLVQTGALDRFIAAEAEVHALRERYRDAEREIPSATCFDGDSDLIVHVESATDMVRLKKLERRFVPMIRTAESRRDALIPALTEMQHALLDRVENSARIAERAAEILRAVGG
ncbi:hypothetical protein P6144_18280 [Sphingomonas sp. HITSZ_GF]|uniref:hypothetical protein n=1 Tax=Sphingomonas sp. HITSZ_GF TaxID=3037247 RepID=UPI00240CF2D2|nr:hypothetical protein [Sphingomonas sp. HITSZ_GF]MDG2535615.1 hypothetical protein [Sphingomonas sp. HITSZ_GF]